MRFSLQNRGLLAAACGLLAAALCWPLLAQLPDNLISIQVKRVILYATVRETKGGFVGDLQKDDFEVLEDGVRQEIVSFSREDLPVATGILVDNSQSMMNKQSEVVAAAKSFVRASNTKDEIFVLHFNEKLTYGLPTNTPFTSDHALLAEALDRMQLDGRTALYDGILEALNHLKKSDLTKKALFVISD